MNQKFEINTFRVFIEMFEYSFSKLGNQCIVQFHTFSRIIISEIINEWCL